MQVRHDQTVTWLAFWKDTISDREYKVCVWGGGGAFSMWKRRETVVQVGEGSVCGGGRVLFKVGEGGCTQGV